MAGAPLAADKLLRRLPAGRQALYASSIARGQREVEGGGGAGRKVIIGFAAWAILTNYREGVY